MQKNLQSINSYQIVTSNGVLHILWLYELKYSIVGFIFVSSQFLVKLVLLSALLRCYVDVWIWL
jgi:hypothetical protein